MEANAGGDRPGPAGGRQHYYPAALIGEFGEEASSKRGRRRPVWVARRGVPQPFRAAAQDVGVDRQHPRLYDPQTDQGFDLDRLWTESERRLGHVRALIDCATEHGQVPAEGFVTALVPFVAQLLARHPELWTPHPSDLRVAGPARDSLMQGRSDLFGRFCDTLLYRRRWLLLDTSHDQPLVATDIGWHWMPGELPGELFVPVSPGRALVVRGGDASYTLKSHDVDLPTVIWHAEDVAVRRDAMVLAAPREVYAHRRELAQHAVDAWAGAAVPPGDIARGLALPAAGLAAAFLSGSASDPRLAWGRFMVANHRWACQCEDELRDQGVGREKRRARVRELHALQRTAEESLGLRRRRKQRM